MIKIAMKSHVVYKSLQVSTGHALKNSDDTKVIEAYNNKREAGEQLKMVVYDGAGCKGARSLPPGACWSNE